MKNEYFEESFVIDRNYTGKRIDHVCLQYFDESHKRGDDLSFLVSRTKIQKFIQSGNILVNDVPVKQSYVVKKGDTIYFHIPWEHGEKLDIQKEKIYFEVLYNDNDLVVLNKPQGLVVHPAYGHKEHTLVNALMYIFPDLIKNTNLERMGIVHRLDKDTSGVMIVTKNETAQQNLIDQFKNRMVKKEYVAIVHGIVKQEKGEINTRIGRNPLHRKRMAVLITDGKVAVTEYKVKEILRNATLMRLMPYTGRTHQLRVHMHYINHPIVGDDIYSRQRGSFARLGLMLCARKIKFNHPRTNTMMEFEVKIPERFQIILKKGEI